MQNKQIKISIDDKEDTEHPIIKIDILDGRVKIVYHASSGSEEVWQKVILPRQKEIINAHDIRKEIDTVIDTIYKVYKNNNKSILISE